MTAPRFGRFQKATALLPLALLSAAVTSTLVGAGPVTVAVADEQVPAVLPDGTTVPEAAYEEPVAADTDAGDAAAESTDADADKA